MEGFVILHRKITEWQWYMDSNTFRLFIHLLLKATHKPIKWMNIELFPGQLVTGRKSLSQDLKLSEQAIRTSLRKLKSSGELTTFPTNKYSVITITNWDKYQYSKCKKQPAEEPTSDPEGNQQSTTYNTKTTKHRNIRRIFIPPLFSEFKAYFIEHGFSPKLAERAFKGYEEADWHDSNNKPVTNWKQKCQYVWFKEENRKQDSNQLSFSQLNTPEEWKS